MHKNINSITVHSVTVCFPPLNVIVPKPNSNVHKNIISIEKLSK